MSDEREGLPPPSLPLRVRVRPGPHWAAGRGGGEEAPRGGAPAHLVRHGPPFPAPRSPPAPQEAPHRLGALTQVGRKASLWKPVWVTFGPNTITVAVLSRDEERMTADGMPSGDGIAVTQPPWPFSVPRRTERLGHVSLAFTSLLASLSQTVSVVVSRPAIDKGKVVVGVETSRRPPHFSARTLRDRQAATPGGCRPCQGGQGILGETFVTQCLSDEGRPARQSMQIGGQRRMVGAGEGRGALL